jgi:lysophospholipase L1-like esterase
MWMRSMMPRLTVEGSHNSTIAGLFLGELSPEFKYGFVLRGVLDELFERMINKLPSTPESYGRLSTEQKIAKLRGTFDDRFVEPNLECVEQFLAYSGDRGIEVCILEGRYSPLAANQKLDGLRAQVRDELERLSSSLEHVSYVRSDELRELGEADFRDLTHVNWEVGERLSGAFIERLEGGVEAASYNPAANPIARNSEWWQLRAERLEERVLENPNSKLLFIGDSITHAWETEGADVWARNYASLDAINLGVSGDRTEHVLWRLQETDWDSSHPGVAVLMIGTNNVGIESQTAAEIVGGVDAVVEELHGKLPGTQILLLSLLPRGTSGDPLGAKLAKVNLGLAALPSRPFLHYFDVYAQFQDAEGNASLEFMRPDRLHLNPVGYAHWASLMEPLLNELLQLVPAEGQAGG